MSFSSTFPLCNSSAAVCSSGSEAISVVYHRLLEMGSIDEADVAALIFTELLRAACDYRWREPVCAQGSISRVISLLQGRTDPGAARRDERLPQDVEEYRKPRRTPCKKRKVEML